MGMPRAGARDRRLGRMLLCVVFIVRWVDRRLSRNGWTWRVARNRVCSCVAEVTRGNYFRAGLLVALLSGLVWVQTLCRRCADRGDVPGLPLGPHRNGIAC